MKVILGIRCRKSFKHSFTISTRRLQQGRSDIELSAENIFIINGLLRYLDREKAFPSCSAFALKAEPWEEGDTNRENHLKSQIFYIPNDIVCFNGMEFEFEKTEKISTDKDPNVSCDLTAYIRSNSFEVVSALIETAKRLEIDVMYPDKPTGGWYFYDVHHEQSKRHERTVMRRLEMTTRRTFSSVFFANKADMLATLHDFESRCGMWSAESHRAHKMCILMHGPPGTGKSSIIKALANRTRRDVVKLDMRFIKNDSALIDAICLPSMRVVDSSGELSTVTVPIAKRLYVIEDMDAAGVDDIIGAREEKKEKKMELIRAEGSAAALMLASATESNLTLSGLLNILDGVFELQDVMMCITTNNVKKFDPALIRPGRMDLVLELGFVTPTIINSMLTWYYKTSESRDESILLSDGSDWAGITAARVEECCQLSATRVDAVRRILAARNALAKFAIS